jgi:hypothetical protein
MAPCQRSASVIRSRARTLRQGQMWRSGMGEGKGNALHATGIILIVVAASIVRHGCAMGWTPVWGRRMGCATLESRAAADGQVNRRVWVGMRNRKRAERQARQAGGSLNKKPAKDQSLVRAWKCANTGLEILASLNFKIDHRESRKSAVTPRVDRNGSEAQRTAFERLSAGQKVPSR